MKYQVTENEKKSIFWGKNAQVSVVTLNDIFHLGSTFYYFRIMT